MSKWCHKCPTHSNERKKGCAPSGMYRTFTLITCKMVSENSENHSYKTQTDSTMNMQIAVL